MNKVSLVPLPVKLIPPPSLHGKILREQVRVMIDKEARVYNCRRNATRREKLRGEKQEADEQNCCSQDRRSKTTAPGGTPLTDKLSLMIAVKDSLSNGCAFHLLHQRRQQDDVAGAASSSGVAVARSRSSGGAPGTTSARRSIANEEVNDKDPPSLVAGDDEIDDIYRLRMSEWSYRVVDYFGVSREIVAISFDYLDRFIDSEVIDSEVFSCVSAFAYKLASITALCIALKVHNRKTIKTSMLANLSQGEITVQDINAMETLMLNALSYHLCPPTCHAFISLFYACMPSAMKERAGLYVMHQTIFMSEISVMKVCFKDIPASNIAFGAMLSVMDSLDATIVSPCERAAFVKEVLENCFLLTSASSCSARTTAVWQESAPEKDLTASRVREACLWSGVNRARYQFERIGADCRSASCFKDECRDDEDMVRVSPGTIVNGRE